MSDRVKLEQLILAKHPCVTIASSDEGYALTLLRESAVEAGREMWLWTVTEGLREGLLSKSPALPQTEHPAAALFHLSRNLASPALVAVLDLPGHLKDERVLRTLRETIEHFEKTGAMLVMIHPAGDLPPAVTSVSTAFDLSFPDKEELEAILKETVRAVASERQIQVNLSRHG